MTSHVSEMMMRTFHPFLFLISWCEIFDIQEDIMYTLILIGYILIY
jgi:hypothetical protein